MSCTNIKECIKPGTSDSLIRHILFTDSFHYGHLSHDATVAKYKGTVLGESLDFDKMAQTLLPPPPTLAPKSMECIKPYVFKSFPKDHHIVVGDVLEIEGYIRGQDIVLKLDPIKHPSAYKHIPYCTGVIFDKEELNEHFKPIY